MIRGIKWECKCGEWLERRLAEGITVIEIPLVWCCKCKRQMEYKFIEIEEENN